MATKSITDRNGKKVPYSVTTNYLVDYGDGTREGSFILNPTQAQIQADYNSKHPVVVTPPVIIPPKGTPRTITIKDLSNLNGSNGENLIVSAGNITDQCAITNCDNTTIDLSAVTATVKQVPVFELQGVNNGMTFKGGNFKDCDGGIFDYGYSTPFDGTVKTAIQGLILSGHTADNCGPLFTNWKSKITANGFQGVIQGLQVIGLTFKNSGFVGSIVMCQTLEGYLIQNCVVDNINFNNTDHNGIFMVGGNGIFQGNKCTNHQGNVLRSQPYQIMSDGKTVLCDKNIVIGSTRYSAFECQVMPADLQTYAGMKPIKSFDVTNNVAGTLSTDHQRNGVLLDKYLISKNANTEVVNVSNNTGFNMFALDGDINQMIAPQGGAVMPNLSGNKYYPTVATALAAGVVVS